MRQKKIIGLVLAVLLIIIVLLPRFVFHDDTNSDMKTVPASGYAPEITDVIIHRADYIEADMDTKMDIYYDFLCNVSSDGYEVPRIEQDDVYELILDPNQIIVDRDNMTISFYEQCEEAYRNALGNNYGKWFRYDFVRKCLLQCDVNEELYFWLQDNNEFVDADTDTQMNMFYEKLKTMEEGTARMINDPIIRDSIQLDRVNQTISYKPSGSDYTFEYSFETNSFSPYGYEPRWANLIGE